MTRYTCKGDVRSDCGIMHRTLGAAWQCISRDGKACAGQGGYTDRYPEAVEDGESRDLTEREREAYFEYAEDQGYWR
jgi:hypothetical protein